MNAKPILFSAPMVRAILAGRKTQTRRLAKLNVSGRLRAPGSNKNWHPDDPNSVRACPYGRQGDLMWVAETFIFGKAVGGYAPDVDPNVDADGPTIDVIYRADDGPNERTAGPWSPSTSMPRWASRLTLRITDVRVQRLHDITDADAVSEGVEPFGNGCGAIERGKGKAYTTLRGAFALLWADVNGPGSWESNPWVWALTFDIYRKNVDEL